MDRTQTGPIDPPPPPSLPPRNPPSESPVVPGAFSDSKPDTASQKRGSSSPQPRPSSGSRFLERALSKDNKRTARRFFSAYAQTWVGLSPVWLMGEALAPGTKVGTQFNKGRKKLVDSAEEVRQLVATSGRDVVVIVDEKLRSSGGGGGKQIAERTAEVIKAAGENAILVVTASLDKLTGQLSSSELGKGKGKGKTLDLRALAHDPALKASLQRHGRDAIVLLDGALAHPVIVTGVAQFARSRGLPHADALLRLARLGLGRILAAIPELVPEDMGERAANVQAGADERLEATIEEIDAEELERQSTTADRAEAEDVGRAAETAAIPKMDGEVPGEGDDPYAGMKKRNDCVVM
ncbi:hypothetical protein M0805_000406 [Coniferiporia weirii]|nr:hypothetical protein M0805_000406 [Coniferiporia weirii]